MRQVVMQHIMQFFGAVLKMLAIATVFVLALLLKIVGSALLLISDELFKVIKR